MSITPDKCLIMLVFHIDLYAPKEYQDRWIEFMDLTFSKRILELWKSFCKLESNKNLPCLDRCEKGLGGDNNTINKQIRLPFRLPGHSNCVVRKDEFIMNVYNTEHEKWTFEELYDLLSAFKELCNLLQSQEDCTVGYIKIIKT